MLQNNPIVYLFRMLWRFSEGNRRKMILYMTMFALAYTSSLLTPLFLAKILNVIQEQGINEGNFIFLLFLLSLFLVQTLFAGALNGPARVMERKNAFLARANYRKFMIDGVMAMPLAWQSDHHSGDTIDKIDKGAGSLYQFVGFTYEYVYTFVAFFGSFIALSFFDIISALVAVVVTVVAISIILRFDKWIIPLNMKLNTMDNKIAAKIYDVISNITTVVILRVEELLSKDVMRAVLKPLGIYNKRNTLSEWKWFIVAVSSSSMFLFVIGSYIWGTLGAGEVVLVGTISALYGYTQRVNGVFSRSAYLYNSAVQWRTDMANAEELSDDFPVSATTQKSLQHDWHVCSIQSLTFSYHGTDSDLSVESDLHLDDVSLSFKRGEKIAVIGESGSGKTTLLKILRGLYEPQSVMVVLDGDILGGGFDELSNDIALIPQDPEIFTATIRHNITIGIDRTEEEIKHYTDLARFSDVVTRLPKGLDSSIVEKGVNLSGGEKQRLALARGLMASEDKSLLLLDESTSSVDPENEAVIYENILKTYPDKTILASIHRLHLLRMFDTIYLFDKGKILDSGTFEGLLGKSNKFQAMWENYTKTQEG